MSLSKQIWPIWSGNGQAWMTTTNRMSETIHYLSLMGEVGNRWFSGGTEEGSVVTNKVYKCT